MSSYESILKLAINNEVEAYEFYLGVAKQVQDANLKSMFQEMADQELSHKDLLSSYLDGKAKALTFKDAPDYKVSKTVDKPKLSLEMKPVDAIALAMKNEEDAMNMYQKFADASADDEQKQLFLNLVKMEQGHKAHLEDIYTNMAFPEAW